MKKICIFILGSLLVCLAAGRTAGEKAVQGGLVPDGETPGFAVFATGEGGGQVEPCG